MNKNIYMVPSIKVKEISENETILAGSGGLEGQSDGTYTQTGLDNGSTVKAEDALSKHSSIWEDDEEDW
jgi:hypothetical protein